MEKPLLLIALSQMLVIHLTPAVIFTLRETILTRVVTVAG